VIAGFQNSYDQKANFVVFDLSVSELAPVTPKIIALDAQVDVTRVLDNHEAITGMARYSFL